MSREALKLALEALENPCRWDLDIHKTIAEIKAALAQPEQEPVAWAYVNSDDECEQIEYCTESPLPEFVPLYASPPKRIWVGLTDADFDKEKFVDYNFMAGTRFAEAKLKEKNT